MRILPRVPKAVRGPRVILRGGGCGMKLNIFIRSLVRLTTARSYSTKSPISTPSIPIPFVFLARPSPPLAPPPDSSGATWPITVGLGIPKQPTSLIRYLLWVCREYKGGGLPPSLPRVLAITPRDTPSRLLGLKTRRWELFVARRGATSVDFH